jgi:hypothetical protein
MPARVQGRPWHRVTLLCFLSEGSVANGRFSETQPCGLRGHVFFIQQPRQMPLTIRSRRVLAIDWIVRIIHHVLL